jgi:hypothetical protein
MIKKIAVFITGLALSIPVAAGDIGFANGQSCTVTANVVNCSADGLRGSMVVESSVAHFIELRDAIAENQNWTATVTCTQAMVDNADCLVSELGTQVSNPLSKQDVAELWISAVLRSIVVNARLEADVEVAKQNVDTNVDIGG